MIKRTLKALAKVAWFIPAFLLWASYPPIGEKTDVFFALAPLIWFARNRSPRESFRLWFLNGFLFWAGTLAWMPAIVKNGGPWPLVVLGWGGLTAYCALYFGLFGYLSSRIWRRAAGSYWKRLAAIFIAEPVLWAGLELVRSNLMGGFAWNHLGVAAVKSGFGAGAALGGVYVLSMMIVLVNGSVASIAERILTPWLVARKKQMRLGDQTIELDENKTAIDGGEVEFNIPQWVRSLETVILVVLVFSIHYMGKSYVPVYSAENSGVLSVGLIQPNFPSALKKDDSESNGDGIQKKKNEVLLLKYEDFDFYIRESYKSYVSIMRPEEGLIVLPKQDRIVLSESAFKALSKDNMGFHLRIISNKLFVLSESAFKALYKYAVFFMRLSDKTFDLIVLPESAFSEFECHIGTKRCEEVANILLALSGAKGVVGGGCREFCGMMYNSAALYQKNPNDSIRNNMQVYDKVHLVPFGEYIPGDELIPALKKFAPVGSCSRGEPKLLDFNGFKLGVAICFEDTDSQLVRKFADMGADALIFITNDSWFYGSEETEQHAWQAIARAVETGLPVIRVGNSGVTGVVYPDGRSSWLTGKDGGLLVDQKGCKVERVFIPPKSDRGPVPYVTLGDIPLFVVFVLTLLFIFFPAVVALRLKPWNKDVR